MDLSPQVQAGLKLLTDLNNSFKTINKAFNTINNPREEPISGCDHYALSTVLVLACKHNYDDQQLHQLLEMYIPNADVVDKIVSKYFIFKNVYTQRNAQFGIALPHVTDANWTLRSDLSSSSYSVSPGNLTFSIELESFNYKTNLKEPAVRFTCTPEELQLLINKLKDIELNCDKHSKVALK
ncbi:COMM domain-containing protein 3 [Toxorhynchites rutilus septentrionalis]|uniref:COMM domain-containing protein 3 n=1 Tax=Toxorhynchites rutilus septentrionalis TaxID=329112 RepID=UPI002479BD36|nr:COMM domain-containing protein 3 [Toxorhynchites rutilus septentrionalis]